MALIEGKSWSHYVQVPGNDGSLGHVVLYFTEFYDAAENYSVVKATGGVVNHSTMSGTFYLNLSVKTNTGIILLQSADGYIGVITKAGTAAELKGNFPYTSEKIYHSSNGELSITVTMKVITMNNDDHSWEVWNTSGTLTETLTRIQRPSAVIAGGAPIGQPITINIAKASTSYTHTLRYAIGETEGLIAEKTTAHSVSWIPPMELCYEISDGTSGGCPVYCETYSGDTLIGTTETVARLTIPLSVAPKVTDGWVQIRPYNEGTAAAGTERYIQGISRVQALFDPTKIDLSEAYGATVKHYSISAEEITVTAEPYITAVLDGSGKITVRCSVTDSRGRTAGTNFEITVDEHSGLRISEPDVFRCIEDGAADDNGTFAAVRCKVSGSEGGGTVTLRCRLKINGGEFGEYIPMQSEELLVIGGGLLSTESTYIVEISAVDELGNTTVCTEYIPTVSVFFHGRDGGKGAAFGKYAEADGVLDVAWEIRCPSLKVNDMTLEEYILAVVNGTAAEGSE